MTGLLEFDILPYKAADFQVRFHYYDAVYEYWWALDDISIIGTSTLCGAPCVTSAEIVAAMASWPEVSVLNILEMMSNLCP